MSSPARTFIVIAKRPAPGRVKTRLTPSLTPEQAAAVAAACLTDTLHSVSRTPAQKRILAFDGPAEEWLPPQWGEQRQCRGGLDARLAHAIGAAGQLPTLLIGMDTPQVTPDLLARFDPIRYDACLGLCADGGYWAIGFREPARANAAIIGIVMSQPDTGVEQLRRLESLGLRVQLLPSLVDVDTIEAARIVAAASPDTTFARTLTTVDLDGMAA